MAYQRNLSINQNNVVNVSGSRITLTGSLTGSEFSGSRLQSTIISASVVSASQYLGLNLTASVITGTELNIDYIDFVPQTTEPSWLLGRVFYDGSGSLTAYTDVEDVGIDLGQQLMLRCHNNTGGPINKGTVVRLTTTTNNSDTPRIVTASWDDDASSAATLGVVVKTIPHTQNGYVILNGILTNIDTQGTTEGQILYLSSSGLTTTTVPVAPKHEVRVAQVVRVANNGTIFVRVQNGYEIEELHNVLVTNRQNGDLIAYDSGSTVWKNTKTLSGSYQISGGLAVTGSLNLTSDIVVSTSPDGNGVTVGNGAGTSFTNTVVGYNSLSVNTTGINNTALGNQALASNRTGNNNVSIGHLSLLNNSVGARNVAIGCSTLNQNISGSDNLAIGNNALINNTASSNIAIGSSTLFNNVAGNNNIGIGRQSLESNTSGNFNVSVGNFSLQQNTTGINNIGIGYFSVSNNKTGTDNIGIGSNSLLVNSVGTSNVAIGNLSLAANKSGSQNIALGSNAGRQLSNGSSDFGNIFIGHNAGFDLLTGSGNIFLGRHNIGTGETNLSDTFILKLGLIDRVRVDSTGNMAIGRTNANARLHVSGSAIIDSNLTVTGTISGAIGQFNSLSASTADITTLTSSNAFIPGNLQVNGTASIAFLNTVNQTSLQIGDKYITILSGATDHATLDGSGILWGSGSLSQPTQNELGSHAHVRYRLSNDTLEIFPGLTVGSGSNFTLITSSSISASQYVGIAAGAANQIQFNSGVDNTLAADSTFVWSAAQRLGVGTATPTSKLQVVGGDAVINSVRVGLGNGSQSSNLVVGVGSLSSNTDGAQNTAVGTNTLQVNQSGSSNTAVGNGALQLLNTSTNGGNTAIGALALNSNQAADNTAVGKTALSTNISGSQNVAIGANSIAFSSNPSFNVAVGHNTLRFNNSSQNVAIGWGAGRELASPTNTSADNVFVGYNTANALLTGSGNVFLGSQAGSGLTNISNTFILSLGATERARIDSDGDLGIGTSNPQAKLHVQGTANIIRSETTTARGGGQNWIQFNDPSGEAGNIGFRGITNELQIANQLSSSIGFATNLVSRMEIQANGRVSIGAAAGSNLATETLDVRANVGATAGDGARLGEAKIGTWLGSTIDAAFTHNNVKNTANSYAIKQNTSGATTLNAASGQTVGFSINNSSVMTMNNIGLGILKTPTVPLDVNGNTVLSGTLIVSGNISSINGVSYIFPTTQGVSGSVLANNGAGTLSWSTSVLNASQITVTNDSTTNSTRNLMFASTVSGPSSILADSDLTYNPSTNTLTVGTLVESSSRQFKTEIQSITNQLEKVVKLNPVSYVRKKDNKQELGLIAEEVKEIYPEFVVGQGINYPKMVSVLVSAVKELTEKVENQSKEIELLKTKKKRNTRGKK